MSFDYPVRLAYIFSRLDDHPSLRGKDIRPFLMGFSPFFPFQGSFTHALSMGYNLPFTFSGVCSYSFAASSLLAHALLPLQDQWYLIVTRCPDLDLLRTALQDSSVWFLSHFVASYLKKQVPSSFFSSNQNEIAVHFLDTEHRVAVPLEEHTKNRIYSLAFVADSAIPFDFVSFLRDPDLA